MCCPFWPMSVFIKCVCVCVCLLSGEVFSGVWFLHFSCIPSLSAIFLREVFECTWIQTEKLSNEMSTNKTKKQQTASIHINRYQTHITNLYQHLEWHDGNDQHKVQSYRKIVWKVLKNAWSPKWHGVASYGSCAVWTVNTKTSYHKLNSDFQHSNGVLKKKDLCWICWLRICDMFHWPCWWRCNMYHDVHRDLLMSLLGARTALKGPSWERNTTQESENHMKIMRSTRKYKEVTSPSLSHHSSLAPSSWTCFHWSLDGRERGKAKVSKEDGGYIYIYIFVCEGVHIGTVVNAPQMPTMSNPRRKSVWEWQNPCEQSRERKVLRSWFLGEICRSRRLQ